MNDGQIREKQAHTFQQACALLEGIKPVLRIAVVYGGDKNKDHSVLYRTHNTRPWKSYETVARDIARALSEVGFRKVNVFPDDINLLGNLQREGIHLAWLNTGGMQGYIPTAHAAGLLEMAGVPYIGHNPMNAALLDNKHIFKTMLQKFNIRTSPFIVWSRSSLVHDRSRDQEALRRVFGDYPGPFIVKPTSGRASLHVHYVAGYDELFDMVNEVYHITQNLVIVEKYAPGKEYCVSICGPVVCVKGECRRHAGPFAFSLLERRLEADERIFTSMDKKPITPERVRVLDGADGDPVAAQLTSLAQNIYKSFFLETLVRIDIRTDENGELVVLETNPKPDLKKPDQDVTSLTCMGLPEQGMSYNDLITGLLLDRLDYLMTYRPDNIAHITSLLPGARTAS